MSSRQERQEQRRAVILPEHGTRRRYALRCRCLPCRAANAAYQETYRESQRTGLPLLGARMSGKEARARLRALRAERVSQRRGLAQPFALKRLRLTGEAVTVRTLLRLRRLCRLFLAENPDAPDTEARTIRR